MIDIILVLILGGVTWCVASEGFSGAVQTAIICIISGLVAMNFFEPLAATLEGILPAAYAAWSDSVALIGLFAISVTILRLVVERVDPGFPDARRPMYEAGRWLGALLSGYVTMAFLLTTLHTAPLPREFMGFKPERANLLGLAAPDRQWLGFTQYVSEKSLRKWGNANVFDGPQMQLGSSEHPYQNDVWASFPIRYATRRENLSASATAIPPLELKPPPKKQGPQSNPSGGF